MVPIFEEYTKFLKDKTGLELESGKYWLDSSIIRAFDRDLKEYKLYRLKVEDDLSMSYSIPKHYPKVDGIEFITHEEMAELYRERVEMLRKKSLELVKDKFEKFEGYIPIVPVSTGKDSMVTLDIVRTVIPDAQAIFNNTSLDVADTYIMAKKIDDCVIMSPQKGFYNYVIDDHMIPTRFGRFCCKYFKTGVMVSQLDHKKPYLLYMGMRNDESDTRSDYGDEFKNIEWGKTSWQGILPIREWNDIDIWMYIFLYDIQINPKYKKGYQRVGCGIACPYYTKATWVLDEYWYPTMRKRWITILENDFVEHGKATVLNCTKEEYTQKAWCGGVFRDEPTEEVITEFMEYKHIADRNLADKYFSNKCASCGKKLKKDEVALSMKYFGRQATDLLCLDHLHQTLDKTKTELREDIKSFKAQGCTLF